MDDARLKYWLDQIPVDVPAPPTPDAWGRAGRNLANLPGNITEGFANTLISIGNPVGYAQGVKADIPDIMPVERGPISMGETASDVVLGKQGIVDTLGQSLAEVYAAGGAGRALGMSEGPALESLKWAAGFAGPETQREGATGTDVAVAGALGAASGPFALLPRKQRLLPTALMSLLHGAYEQSVHGDPLNTGIAVAADFLGTMVPGAHVPKMRTGDGPLSFKLEDNPLTSWDNPQNLEQHQMYKQELATLQSEQAVKQAEIEAYNSRARSSLKEGIRIINPEALPEHVPYSDLLASFEASLPERGTAAGNAMRRTPLVPEGTFDPFATLQKGEVDPMLLNPPDIITGATPRPDVSLFGESSAINPEPLVPVEAFGAARSAEEIAAMQKAQKMRRPRAKKESPAPAPVVEEPIVPPPPEAPRTVGVTPEQVAYHVDRLKNRNRAGVFAKETNEIELRNELSALDNDIANTLDPEALSDFQAARQAVELLLNEATPTAAPVVEAVKPKDIFTINARVASKDKRGRLTHGIYEGMDESGQAKIRFDGDTEATKVSPKKLVKSDKAIVGEVPEFATLQKVKEKFTVDDADIVAKWLADEEIKGPMLDDDAIPDEIAGQDLKFETRVGTSVGGGTRLAETPGTLPEAAVKAVDQLVHAIKQATNKHLDIKFKGKQNFGNGVGGQAFHSGEIELNLDNVLNKLGDWNKMDAKTKAKSLHQFSNIVGHEVGHVMLSFVTAKNQRLLSKLLSEFEALGEEGRTAIIGDYHRGLGLTDRIGTMYAAGTQTEMINSYGIHPANQAELNYRGLHEFFAEMSAAHMFGKLKAELLPPEMAGFWEKFKAFVGKIYDRLFSTIEPDQADMPLAYQNFKKMVGEIHERFNAYSEANMRDLSEASRKKNDALMRKFKNETRQLEELELASKEKIGATGLEQEGTYDLPLDRFATLQDRFNAPPGALGSKIVGNQSFIESQLAQHLVSGIGGAIAGGALAPHLTDNQMTVAEGVFAGGVLGLAGPVALKRMFLRMPKQGNTKFQHFTSKEAFKMLFTSEGRRALGGDGANGQGSAVAQFMRSIERNLNMHLPPEIFNAVVESEGPASYAVQIAHDAFSKSRGFETNDIIDTAVKKFLAGKSNASDLRRVLGTAPEAQDFANFIVTGREAIGLLQGMVASGLRDGAFKNQIIASLQKGDYMTRMYRMFHDPDYKPTQSQIEELSLELTHANPEYDMVTSRAIVEDYLHQIEVERGMYKGGKGDMGQKLDAAIFTKRNDRLSAAFRDALGEYTDPKEQILGTIRHLYTNAISSKFYDEVANMTDPNGLKMSYGFAEHGDALRTIEAKLRRPPAGITAKEIATLQKQKQELQFYVPLDSSSRYGKLGGKLVNRFVRDQLASYDSPWGLMDGSIMRGLASFNNAIKVGRTAFNPITVVRNIVSAPILMGIARANPKHVMKGGKVWEAMRNLSGGLGKEMLEQGIFGVDQVRGEFFRSADALLMGDYDMSGIEGVFKQGVNKVLEFYRTPDTLVRGATYLSAKERFAQKMRLPETDKRVIDAARNFTNRYTVNYANVAPLVKTARQIPLVNLFISWTAEMTRISKNLIEDTFTHPDMAQRVWSAGAIGGLSSIPFLMEKASLSNLSKADRAEWEKSQAQMPDYSRNRFRVVLGKEGNRFRYLDITPVLQIDSLLQMMRSGVAGDWKALLATNPVLGWENSPMMNIVAQQMTGKDSHTQRPLDTKTKRFQSAVKEILPPIAPGGFEWQRISEALAPNDSGSRGVMNLRTGRTTTPSDLVTSYLTGIRPGSVDTTQLHQQVVASAKRQIANEGSYLRDVVQTNLPPQAKAKAVERYKKAVAEILTDMHSRLEGKAP